MNKETQKTVLSRVQRTTDRLLNADKGDFSKISAIFILKIKKSRSVNEALKIEKKFLELCTSIYQETFFNELQSFRPIAGGSGYEESPSNETENPLAKDQGEKQDGEMIVQPIKLDDPLDDDVKGIHDTFFVDDEGNIKSGHTTFDPSGEHIFWDDKEKDKPEDESNDKK